MGTELSMAEARSRLTQLPEELTREPGIGAVTVTRRGKPVLAVMSWDLYESVMETLEILGEPELMAALRESIREASEGKTISWASVKAEMNL